ncbi:MEMO1 family protein [Candidatus Micrarchaeota archaeon]|nr:MEMO1 family protein [Candidatus Micrarchaeota archaeon]
MRLPAVAGQFYPVSTRELGKMFSSFFDRQIQKKKAYGIVSPHAGYAYSGRTAALAFASIKNLLSIDTVIFIGPNHTGKGEMVSISLEDWQTPLGISQNNRTLGQAIINNSNFISHDEEAHRWEHSIEVQLPFLQFLHPKAKIVPICMLAQDIDAVRDVGEAIYEAEKETNSNFIVVASSDFSHFIPAEEAEKKDKKAIEFIEKLDYKGFQKYVEENNISICGQGPIASLMYYIELKGGKKAELLEYTNSGATTGDYRSVVAYASLLFPKVIP